MRVSAITTCKPRHYNVRNLSKKPETEQTNLSKSNKTASKVSFKSDRGAVIGIFTGALVGLGAAMAIVATGGLAAAVAAVGATGVGAAGAGAGAQIGGIIGGIASGEE